ncbi:MAG: hypothetical protein ACR2PX_21335 [Endozoicomonas sp.]|uniref:hypothetical protein n=1 Tax=Endozoicomonas sp. TaxID=1892382 RepID=UPI003D9AE8B6
MVNSSLVWQTGNPMKAGYYLVAVLYENGLGFIGSDYWDTELGWSIEDEIVGFIPLNQLVDSVGLEFPLIQD